MVECPKCGNEMKFREYTLTGSKGLKKTYVCKNKGCNYKIKISTTGNDHG